ncbi:MAG: hypothetical protein AAFV53_08915 [Myxococcota bacterium]
MGFAWLVTHAALAGSPPPALVNDVHQRYVRTEQRGMLVLGGWAAVNIAAGSVGALTADDPTVRAFHQGNAAWNLVNLGIAIPGYLGARKKAQQPPAWPALPVEMANQRGVFLLNLGLDVAYMTGGVALWQLQDDPQLDGFGQALLLQGAFLGAFDLTMAILNSRDAKPLRPYLRPDAVGFSVAF